MTRTAPMRADAEGLFIPIDDLADATVGDGVAVSGPAGDDVRTGVIAELTEAPSGRFFRIELDD